MLTWRLGEKRYAYVEASSITTGVSFTITSSDYIIYNTSDESVVASGVASIQDHIIYTLWQPSNAGVFVIKFSYIIGSETYSNEQVIEVKETV
jgi:hypothetical protein